MRRTMSPIVCELTLALACGGGCRHALPVAPPAPPPGSAEPAASPTGAVSVRYLVPGESAAAAMPPGQRLVAPFPLARPLPEYPPEALHDGASPATVAVRVLIDTEGQVTRVADSPLAVSTPGRYSAAFRAAVERALAGWEFYPAHIDTVRERDTDGDGRVDDTELVQFTPVEVYYDLAFEFSVVDGRGSVRLAPARAP